MEQEHWPMPPEDAKRPSWVSCLRLERLDPELFDARIRHVDVGAGLALSYLAFGGPVELELGPLLETYLAVIPLRGEVRLMSGGTDGCANAKRAAVIDPAEGHWQVWPAGAEVLFVHVHIRHSFRSRYCPHARLRPFLDLATAAGRNWLDSLMSLVCRADELKPAEPPPPEVVASADELGRELLRLQQVT